MNKYFRYPAILLAILIPLTAWAVSVWPTDDLTNTHLLSGSDDPSQARAEINNTILKVKSILGTVTPGSTVWTSANDGSGTGLDADTVDGYQASGLLARSNHIGYQALSTISDAGSLAALNAVTDAYVSGSFTVPHGGTGKASFTAYGTIIGGTTATGALQSVSPGTFGQVLTSNGSVAAPTFQDGGVAASAFYSTTKSGSTVAGSGSFPGTYTTTIDTGFGTNDFVWGIIGPTESTPSASSRFFATAVDSGGYAIGTPAGVGADNYTFGITWPSTPGTAGQVAIKINQTDRNDSRAIKFKFWARKNL